MSNLSLKELFLEVDACKNTYEFKKMFVLDDCIAQAKALAENLPENLRAKKELQTASAKTFDRLKIQKTHYQKLIDSKYNTGDEVVEAASGIKFMIEREQEAWANYKAVDSKPVSDNAFQMPVNIPSILTVVAFFLFIYLFNI